MAGSNSEALQGTRLMPFFCGSSKGAGSWRNGAFQRAIER
jgi:hypothetical protein